MPKLTYANVMSTLGVFLALGGTSYAVARNSVGTNQLRNSAVTSGKIRNLTVQRKDLSPSARLGTRGPRGAQGVQGVAGARGPSDGYVAAGAPLNLSGTANVAATTARLDSLPAGSYVLSAQAQAEDFTNGGEIVSCDIKVNGQGVARARTVVGVNNGSTRAANLSMIGSTTQSAPFAATLECSSDQALGTPPGMENQHLSAVRVETLKTP